MKSLFQRVGKKGILSRLTWQESSEPLGICHVLVMPSQFRTVSAILSELAGLTQNSSIIATV